MTLTKLRAEAASLSIICQIHRLANDDELNLIAREKFNRPNWRHLPTNQLNQLHAIILSRWATRQRVAREKKQQLTLTF